MPLLSWLIYEGAAERNYAGNLYMWSALIAGTLIGCTDWVDGMLARKYGPTVLGGLLDPIADKVFVAFAYVPFADDSIGLIPAWACALMFVREFFITALRSAYEQRDLSLKTSWIAKFKTWTQMQGIGVILLFPLLENERTALTVLLVLLFIFTWNEFLLATVFLTEQHLFTIVTSYANFATRFSRDWSLTSAAALMMILPIVAIFLLLQRRFIEGIMAGAVKG